MRLPFPLLLLVLAPFSSAQTPPGAIALEGRIVDVLGEPIPAAEVVAVVGRSTVARTTADGEGIYRIRVPAAGSELRVRALGKAEIKVPWRGLTTPKVRNLVLEDAAALTGRVVDAAGAVVPNASVLVVPEGHTSLATTTDANGRYAIQAVPLRPLYVHVLATDTRVDASLRLVADATCDLTLPANTASTCLVRVHQLPAASAADAEVRVFGFDIAAVQNGGRLSLREDGTATLSLRSDCLVEARLAGFVLRPGVLGASASTRRIEFTVAEPLEPEQTIVRGSVRTLAGHAVGGVRLVMRDRSHCEIGSAQSDAQGTFRLSIVQPPDGFCRIGLGIGDWLLIDDEASIRDGCCWVPFPNLSRNLDLLAERTGEVASVLRGPDGRHFVFADVVAVDTHRLDREFVHATTDGTGRVTLGLPPGEFALLAIAGDGQLARAQLSIEAGKPHAPAWQPVLVGEITGVLRDEVGQPVPGVPLLVATTDLQGPVGATASERQRCQVLTDRAGRYRCRSLPIGSWTIAGLRGDQVKCEQVDVLADRQTVADLAFRR